MSQPPSPYPSYQSPYPEALYPQQQPWQGQPPVAEPSPDGYLVYAQLANPALPDYSMSTPIYIPGPVLPDWYTYFPHVPYYGSSSTEQSTSYQPAPLPTHQPAYTPYPQAPYTETVYQPTAYQPYPYPQTILPPQPLPYAERENEISRHGYKESFDYPPDQARKERTIARAVFFSLIVIVISFFLIPSLFTGPSETETVNTLDALIFTFGFEAILILVFSLILRNAFPQGVREALGLKPPRVTHILIGFGSGFVALVFAIIGSIIVTALGADDSSNMDMYTNLPDLQLLIVLFICIPVLAPIFEELLFRGILASSAVRAFPGKTGFFVSIIVTGLVFGSIHFPGTFDINGIYTVIIISCFGVFLTWLRLRFNSSIVSMATHAAYNGSIVAVEIFALLFTSSGTYV